MERNEIMKKATPNARICSTFIYEMPNDNSKENTNPKLHPFFDMTRKRNAPTVVTEPKPKTSKIVKLGSNKPPLDIKQQIQESMQITKEISKGKTLNPFFLPKPKPSNTQSLIVPFPMTESALVEPLWPDYWNSHVGYSSFECTSASKIQKRILPIFDFHETDSIGLYTNDPTSTHSIKDTIKSSIIFISKLDIKTFINTHYQHEIKESPACQELYHRIMDAQVLKPCSDQLWTDKYAPDSISMLLGSKKRTIAQELIELFSNWKQSDFSKKEIQKSCRKKQRQESMEKDDLYGFIIEDEEEDPRFKEDQGRHILLLGCRGSGKSALLNAVAKEMGMNALEIHSGLKRAGKDVMATLGESILNKTMGKSKHSYSVVPKYEVMKNLGSTEDMALQRLYKNSVKTCNSSSNSSSNVETHSLLILDDVDILTGHDKSFWNAVEQLVETSKKPLILTCTNNPINTNNQAIGGSLSFLQEMIHVKHVEQDNQNEIYCFIQLILISEGIWMEATQVKEICLPFTTDLRAILLHFQTFTKTSSTAKEIPLDEDDAFCMQFIERIETSCNSVWNYNYNEISNLEYLNHMAWYTDLESCLVDHNQQAEEPLIATAEEEFEELYLVAPIISMNYIKTFECQLLGRIRSYLQRESSQYLYQSLHSDSIHMNPLDKMDFQQQGTLWMKQGASTTQLLCNLKLVKEFYYILSYIQLICQLDLENFKATGSFTEKGRTRRSNKRSRKYFELELTDNDYHYLVENLLKLS